MSLSDNVNIFYLEISILYLQKILQKTTLTRESVFLILCLSDGNFLNESSFTHKTPQRMHPV